MGLLQLFGDSVCDDQNVVITEKFVNPNGKENEPQSIEYHYNSEVVQSRSDSKHPVHPIFLSRRSERAMDGQAVSESMLMCLFEAARWTPSHLNTQGWHFVYSVRGDQHWDQYLAALNLLNRRWAKDGGALLVVLSRKDSQQSDPKLPLDQATMPSNSFEAGAACMAMLLEATARGLVVHEMGGFDKAAITKTIQLKPSDPFQVEVMMIIGNRKQGQPLGRVSKRNDTKSFVSEGTFQEKL